MDHNGIQFVSHWENGDYEAAYNSATRLANHPEFGRSFGPHEKLGDTAVKLGRIADACDHYSTALRNLEFDVEMSSGYFPEEALRMSLQRKRGQIGCDEEPPQKTRVPRRRVP